MIETGLKAAGKEVRIPKDGLTFCGNKGQDSHSRLKSEAGADVDPNTGNHTKATGSLQSGSGTMLTMWGQAQRSQDNYSRTYFCLGICRNASCH